MGTGGCSDTLQEAGLPTLETPGGGFPVLAYLLLFISRSPGPPSLRGCRWQWLGAGAPLTAWGGALPRPLSPIALLLHPTCLPECRLLFLLPNKGL